MKRFSSSQHSIQVPMQAVCLWYPLCLALGSSKDKPCSYPVQLVQDSFQKFVPHNYEKMSIAFSLHQASTEKNDHKTFPHLCIVIKGSAVYPSCRRLHQEVELPAGFTCERCVLQLLRQAGEWAAPGGGYIFWSCADISIVDSPGKKTGGGFTCS